GLGQAAVVHIDAVLHARERDLPPLGLPIAGDGGEVAVVEQVAAGLLEVGEIDAAGGRRLGIDRPARFAGALLRGAGPALGAVACGVRRGVAGAAAVFGDVAAGLGVGGGPRAGGGEVGDVRAVAREPRHRLAVLQRARVGRGPGEVARLKPRQRPAL